MLPTLKSNVPVKKRSDFTNLKPALQKRKFDDSDSETDIIGEMLKHKSGKNQDIEEEDDYYDEEEQKIKEESDDENIEDWTERHNFG